MAGKIKSIFGGLVLACAVFGEQNIPDDKSKTPSFSSIGVISSNDVLYVELKGNIYSGDLKHYKVQTCSNLVENVWQDSNVNTNVFVDKKETFCVYEPYVFGRRFYRVMKKEK